MTRRPLLAAIAGFLLNCVLSLDVGANQPTLKPDPPERYVVTEGDTLWDIAARFLEQPWYWPDVWHANPKIENPHLIFPGDVISLIYVDGQPSLTVQRGRPVVKLSPQTRVSPLRSAIPTLPIHAIRPFLVRPRVLGPTELHAAAYVVEFAGEHVIGGSGDQIYVRGLTQGDHRNFTLLRPGTVYRDPVTDEVLGHEALYIGDARLRNTGDPATLDLVRATQEVRIGDNVLPATEEELQNNFLPHAPQFAVNGQIISVLNGVSQIGQYQVVVLNRGEREGLEVGHVLSVFQAGRVIRDSAYTDREEMVRLPDQRAGILIVFRTFERVSYGLIMKATRAIHLLDAVRSPAP